MTGHGDDDQPGACSSPPCFLHEIDPAYSGLGAVAEPQSWESVKRWRAAERRRLIGQRLAIPPADRLEMAARIGARLEAMFSDVSGQVVSAYWPVRGEPDLRRFLERLAARGARTALPVVVAPGRPLVFRGWTPGGTLTRGVWGIPTPPTDADALVPDIVIVPVVGFDAACHRLGYGGGFFDRTLAAMPGSPRIVGVGYGQAAIATIHPQPHDIPMHVVVTEERAIGDGA